MMEPLVIMMVGVGSLFAGVGKILAETEHKFACLPEEKSQVNTRLFEYGLYFNKLGMSMIKTTCVAELMISVARIVDPLVNDFLLVNTGISGDELFNFLKIIGLAQIIYTMN